MIRLNSLRKQKTKMASFAVAGVLTMAMLSLSSVARADYDAALDFSTVNNPNGVWSSGFQTTLGGTLDLFDFCAAVPFGSQTLQFWQDNTVNNSFVPAFYKNFGPGTVSQFNMLQGQVALHGGNGGEYAVLRFTAPTSTIYRFSSQFFSGDVGNTDATVLLNSNVATPLFFAPTTNTNPSFETTLFLNSGDTVDYIVGVAGDGFGSDTTPFNLSVQVAPEASSLAFMGASLLPMIGIVRSRRRKK